jgi:hypothetical protein
VAGHFTVVKCEGNSVVAEPLLVPSMTALRLYTDGSCYPPGTVGGWAWILVNEHAVGSDSGVTLGPRTISSAR